MAKPWGWKGHQSKWCRKKTKPPMIAAPIPLKSQPSVRMALCYDSRKSCFFLTRFTEEKEHIAIFLLSCDRRSRYELFTKPDSYSKSSEPLVAYNIERFYRAKEDGPHDTIPKTANCSPRSRGSYRRRSPVPGSKARVPSCTQRPPARRMQNRCCSSRTSRTRVLHPRCRQSSTTIPPHP